MLFLNNLKWSAIESIITLGLSFFVSLVVIRYLGSDDFGTLSYASSIVGLLLIVTGLGIDSVLPKLLSESSNGNQLFTAVKLKLLVSLVFLAVTTLFFLYYNSLESLLILLISSKLIASSFNSIQSFYIYKSKIELISKAKITVVVLNSIFKILIVYFDKGVVWVALSYALDYFILAMILLYKYNSRGVSLLYNVYKVSYASQKELLLLSWPFLMTGVSMAIMSQVDVLMLYSMTDATTVGSYAAALKINEVYKTIYIVIITAAFPVMIRLKKEDDESFKQFTSGIFSITTVFSLCVIIIMMFYSEVIAYEIFGVGFYNVGDYMIVMSVSSLFVGFRLMTGRVLVLLNMGKFTFYRTIRGLIINIVLNVTLIPKYSAYGAAVASLISISYIGLFSDLEDRRLREYYLMKVRSLYAFKFISSIKKIVKT